MSSLAQPNVSLPQASVSLNTTDEPLNIDHINPAIRKSDQWRILVYGINNPNYRQEQNDHHWSLLSGILGEQVTADKQTFPSFGFEKNEMTVTVYIGSHNECNASIEAVDLLLFFLPVDQRNPNTTLTSFTT